MKRSWCLFRDGLHYRRECFRHGLMAAGYTFEIYISDPGPEDVLVIWNRSFLGSDEADRFEKAGARVVVVENGYLGKEFKGGNWYALALSHAAGAGQWNVGSEDRWDSLHVELLPWHVGGGETIILGQREIGEPGIRSPEGWAERIRDRIPGSRIRPHPGRVDSSVPPLEEDLANASSVVTWASSAALRALLLGVPVWYEMPKWIGASAALPLFAFGQEPKRDDAARLAMFRRLAWAQWKIEEINSGEAFNHLLGESLC